MCKLSTWTMDYSQVYDLFSHQKLMLTEDNGGMSSNKTPPWSHRSVVSRLAETYDLDLQFLVLLDLIFDLSLLRKFPDTLEDSKTSRPAEITKKMTLTSLLMQVLNRFRRT